MQARKSSTSRRRHGWSLSTKQEKTYCVSQGRDVYKRQATDTSDMLGQLIEAGANVFRLNMSHSKHMMLPNISHSRRQRLGTWYFSILPITLVRM